MTSDGTGNGPSAVKLGGIALIGVGVLAGAFGAVSAASEPQRTEAQQERPTSPAPQQTSHPQQPAQSEQPSPSQQPPPSQGQDDQQSSVPNSPPQKTNGQKPGDTGSTNDAGQPPPKQTPDEPQQSRIVIRVYNNSTIKGLAHDAAKDFRRAGYAVPEVGNYSAGRIAMTTVYFRPGTPEQAQAQAVAQRFGARLEPRFNGLKDASPGVIAIITNDYSGLDGK